MVAPHGQCLWLSEKQIPTRNAVSGSMGKSRLARGGCYSLRHLSIRPHITVFLLGCCAAGGLHPLNLFRRGAPDAAARMSSCASPRTIARRTPTRERFVGPWAQAAVGADMEAACARTHLGVLRPPQHIPSRSMGLKPQTHPLNTLSVHGGLPATHLRFSGDPCFLCFLRVPCVVSALVDLQNPFVSFRAPSFFRHLPQERTPQ